MVQGHPDQQHDDPLSADAEKANWIRCPLCRHVLGERVAGLALTRHRGRVVLAVFVGCSTHGCRGGWTSPDHRALVDRARGLVLVGVEPD